jgi:hypothetical protein
VEESKGDETEETKEINDVDDWVWKKDKKEKKKKVEKNVGLKKQKEAVSEFYAKQNEKKERER